MAESIQYWATTNAGNANSDSAIASSDTQAPNTVATNIRSLMTALAKARLDIFGGLTAGGTPNALTVTTNQVLISAQLTGGAAQMIKATSTNTSTTVTFAPDGLTAAPIKRADGSALAIGSVQAGMFLFLVYNSGTSEWWAANIAPNTSVLGSAQASFSATKSADQSVPNIGTTTQCTFDGTLYNVGGFFSNSAWTPPAGKCMISAIIGMQATGGENIYIYKNGAAFRGMLTTQGNSSLTFQDSCNGTDVYTLYGAATGGTCLFRSTAALYTSFMGSMV
jgi:hypothetical protein